MAASAEYREPEGLRVTVDRVIHQTDVDAPPDRPYCFVYFITIHNDTLQTVTIKGRKWVVTNSNGEVVALEGEGVVGRFPRLEPGTKFAYNSYHLLSTPTGVAEGSYLGQAADGQPVIARIPRFRLDASGE